MPVTVQSLGIGSPVVAVDEQASALDLAKSGTTLSSPGRGRRSAKRNSRNYAGRVAEDDADPDNLIPWEEVKAKAETGSRHEPWSHQF